MCKFCGLGDKYADADADADHAVDNDNVSVGALTSLTQPTTT